MANGIRTNARMATLAVLTILQKMTDKNHTMRINAIAAEAERVYGLDLHRDTVKGILSDLQAFYGDRQVCCETAFRETKRGGNDYTYNYYWNRTFSNEEVQLLIDDVMFSKMRTVNQVKALTKKLKTLASPAFEKKLNYLEQIPDKQYTINAEVQKNIALIHQAVAENTRLSGKKQFVTFTFNGYGTDKKLHALQEFQALPLRICEANERYYLICYMEGKENISHFRIDLMTDMKKELLPIEENSVRDNLTNNLNYHSVSDYISQHPYMLYESRENPVKVIRLKITKLNKYPKEKYSRASMTIMHDFFGDNWQPLKSTDNDDSVEVQVRCVRAAAELFARQYPDRVEILED